MFLLNKNRGQNKLHHGQTNYLNKFAGRFFNRKPLNKIHGNILFALLFAIAMWSCDVEDCISTKSSKLKVASYTDQLDSVSAMWISFLQADDNDSVLVRDDTVAVLKYELDLNPATNRTRYNFTIIPYTYELSDEFDPPKYVVNDTLPEETHFIDFAYTRRQRIVSQECGVEQSFYDLEIIDHDFKRAEVVSDTIDNFIDSNVKIYF